MEALTTIIASLGSILGLTKNTLELRNTFKDLFKKDFQLNKAFVDLPKRDEKSLIDLYKAIETGRDLATRINKKLSLKYLSTLSVIVILFICAVIIIQTIFPLKPVVILIGFLAGYFLTTLGLPNPFTLNLKYPTQLENTDIGYFTRYNYYNYLNSYSQTTEIKKAIGLIHWITPSEKKYLEHYLGLCSLKDTIELYWIDKKIEEVKTQINETLVFRPTLEKTLVDIIVDMLKRGEDVLKNRKIIEDQIKEAGLERFLSILSDNFFSRDFKDAYQKDSINGILNIINSHWP